MKHATVAEWGEAVRHVTCAFARFKRGSVEKTPARRECGGNERRDPGKYDVCIRGYPKKRG